MTLELLNDIRKAEDEAEKIRADAQREGREIVKAAEEATLSDERSANADVRAQCQSVLEEKRKATEQELKHAEKAKQAQRDALCKAAEKNLDRAAAMIFERVVENGHR